MNTDLLRAAVSHLDENGFLEFFKHLIKHDKMHTAIQHLHKIDTRIFETPPERFYQCADAFVLNYYPYSIYKNFTLSNLDLSNLKTIILKYLKERSYPLWRPVDGTTIYSINNYDSHLLGITDEELLAFYESSLSSVVPSNCHLGLGNINTYFQHTSEFNGPAIIEKFLKEHEDGICISISADAIQASRFWNEKEFSGVTPSTLSIIHPTITRLSPDDILNQFNQLINNNPKESELEDFLYQNYQLILGPQYDQIRRQVWLNLPGQDIGGRNRRMDLFIRNTITKDWEIFELKKPTVKLTKTVRDIPVFTSAVVETIAQARNYQKLLSQDAIKRALSADGIEYYEPVINIVIGKTPTLPTANWRRLVSLERDLNVLTYDSLVSEAKTRVAAMEKFCF